jgi:hypothetical protein
MDQEHDLVVTHRISLWIPKGSRCSTGTVAAGSRRDRLRQGRKTDDYMPTERAGPLFGAYARCGAADAQARRKR